MWSVENVESDVIFMENAGSDRSHFASALPGQNMNLGWFSFEIIGQHGAIL